MYRAGSFTAPIYHVSSAVVEIVRFVVTFVNPAPEEFDPWRVITTAELPVR
jgi:hypothetical protein